MTRLEALAEDGRFKLHGDLTLHTVPELWASARSMFAGEGSLVLDLAGVGASDSAGVALLVDWLKQAGDSARELQLVNVPEQMRAIIRVADLEDVLPIS